MIEKNAKIFICGHRGMVGSACVRKFEREGYTGILKRTHAELDGSQIFLRCGKAGLCGSGRCESRRHYGQ